MLKLFKTLVLALTTLGILLLVAVTAAFLLIDPARYRSALESAFNSQTGLQLEMAGEIAWTLRPQFGIAVNDVRLRSPASPMELASLALLHIRLEPRALLDGRLALQELQIEGLHMNWLVDENGGSNWQRSADQGAPGTVARTSGNPGADSLVDSSSIAHIGIRDASLALQDRQRGLNLHLHDLRADATGANLRGTRFPLQLSFALSRDETGRQAVFDLSTQVRVDRAAGSASIEELTFKLNPLQLQGQLAVENLHDTPRWRGSLQSNRFSLNDFLDLHVREEAPAPAVTALTQDFDPSRDQASLSIDFSGDASQLEIPSLRLLLDEKQIDIRAIWTAAGANAPARLTYSLIGNALDFNAAPASTAAAPTAEVAATPDAQPSTAVPASATAMPVDLLRSLEVDGSHSIASLGMGGLQFGTVDARLTVSNGRLSLNLRPTELYGGQLTAALSYDAQQTNPAMSSIVSLQNLDVGQLARQFPASGFAQGRLNLESFHTAQGSTSSQLLASLNGSTSFSLTDNAIDIGIVKQVFSAISVLSPAGSGDLAQQWPDVVNFARVEGSLSVAGGIASGQQLKLQMDNFEIAATGGVDLTQERFDYAALITVYGEPARQTIPVAPLYQNVGWPVQCSARFDAQYSEFCGPDFGRVRELFVEISRNQVQRRVQDAVTDQVPADLQDAARSLIDRALR
jgi:AsmA protein